ncbi:hypothetical protein BU692_01475 [Staphylococcus chromogenes]|uniref:hypothetical protein n=1 Tax=Staphylococcus chromogenes TaxID=46126 RepID=UPI000D19914D|nr:hypothetical protein [Staphylococcus chromogenes]PTG56806.1 hypothetical protein BU692_01475 [Staphylococcus chromogenes]
MQHSSNVGQSETKMLKIDIEAVRQYQRLCGCPKTEEIPLLFLARYWREFDIFAPFVKAPILLVETEVVKKEPIPFTDSLQATLTWSVAQDLKRFKRFRFELSLPGQNKIRQKFIQKVM